MSWTDVWNELKIILLYFAASLLILAILGFCFNSGQERVHNWEQETGRYGQGLY